MPGEFLPHFSRRFIWLRCFLAVNLTVSGLAVADTTPAASTSTVTSSSTSTPSLGGLALPAAITASTPTYPIVPSTPSVSETEQESKRLSRLARVLKLRTEGNRNIRERVILAQAKTRKGDLYDP